MARDYGLGKRITTTILWGLTFLLALQGQKHLAAHQYVYDGLLFYVLSIALFLWLTHRAETAHQNEEARSPLPSREKGWGEGTYRYRLFAAYLSVIATALAYFSLDGNTFSGIGVLIWLLAIGSFSYAFWEPQRTWCEWRVAVLRFVNREGVRIRINWTYIALILILALGAFFRFYKLQDVPAEMTSDHAEKLLDIYDLMQGKRPIFFTRNTGREPLQFYFTFAYAKLFNWEINHYLLKWGAAFASLLTLPWIYLLAKELYNKRVALFATFFAAVGVWHIAISRVGLRFPYHPVFVAPACYFLIRGMKYNHRNDWLLCGLTLGIGLHGYSPFRVMGLVIAAGVILKFFQIIWQTRRADLSDKIAAVSPLFINAVVALLIALIVFLPLARYMRDYPEVFWYRAASRLTPLGKAEQLTNQEQWHIFTENVKDAFLAFNWQGDVVWVNYISNKPFLGAVSGGLLVLGAVYWLYALLRYRRLPDTMIIIGIFILLLPSTLSIAFPNENPSAVRMGGAIPLIFVLVGLPLYVAGKDFTRLWGRYLGNIILGLCAAFLMVQATRGAYHSYFKVYDAQYRESSWNTTEIAAVMKDFAHTVGDLEHAYLKSWPHWVDHRNVGINLGDPTWDNRVEWQHIKEHPTDPANKLYIVNPRDEETVQLLRELYPQGQLHEYQSSTAHKNFLMYYVFN